MHKRVTALTFFILVIIGSQYSFAQLPPTFGSKYKGKTETDSRVTTYITPLRIVWKSSGKGQTIKNEDHLLEPGNGQANLKNKNLTVLESSDSTKASILLDFGKEIHGGLELVIGMMEGKNPVSVHLRFGESVSEAMSNVGDGKGATNDHAMRDYNIKLPWLGSIQIGNTGVDGTNEGVDVSHTRERMFKAEETPLGVPLLGNRLWSLEHR